MEYTDERDVDDAILIPASESCNDEIYGEVTYSWKKGSNLLL